MNTFIYMNVNVMNTLPLNSDKYCLVFVTVFMIFLLMKNHKNQDLDHYKCVAFPFRSIISLIISELYQHLIHNASGSTTGIKFK